MEYVSYVIASILAILFGQIVGHLNKKMPPVVAEEITYKEFFKTLKTGFKVDIILSASSPSFAMPTTCMSSSFSR